MYESALKAGAGGTLLGNLGRVLSPMDLPRQAVASALMKMLGGAPADVQAGSYYEPPMGGGNAMGLSDSLSPESSRNWIALGGSSRQAPRIPDLVKLINDDAYNGGASWSDGSPVEMGGSMPLSNAPRESSYMPALLGLLAGAGTAFIPGGAAFAPLVGTAAAGLGQGIANMMGSSGNFSGGEVVDQAMRKFGYDDPGMANSSIANYIANMAMDPMSYAGASLGKMMKMPQKPMQPSVLQPHGTPALPPPDISLGHGLVKQTPPTLRIAPQVPSQPPIPAVGNRMPPGFIESPPIPDVIPPQEWYTPEMLAAASGAPMPPTLSPMAGGAMGRSYQRVNPRVSALLQELGFMDEANTLQGAMPNWAGYRGSSVMPVSGMEPAIDHLNDLMGLTGRFDHDAIMRLKARLNAGFDARPKPLFPME